MNRPGENLLIKLWETLAEKGVGSLLKPWQVRREGAAQVDVRRYELLALAEAEREAEEIRSGRRALQDAKYALSLTEIPLADTQPIEACAPPLQIATRSVIADSLRKEVNVAKAITHAESELRDDPAPPTEKAIDEDWLYRWRNYAGEVSSDELQAIWGRILAGESKSPGSYSYRLLEFVKNLTKDEAQLIEKVSSLVLDDFIARKPDSALKEENLNFSTFLELQELGIVAGVEALGLSTTFGSMSEDKFIRILFCHGKGLLVQHADPNKKLKMDAYVITSLGKQVMKLGKFSPNEKYLRAIGSELKKGEFTVSLSKPNRVRPSFVADFGRGRAYGDRPIC